MKKNKKNNGFTLVELAIVMIIIGVLIGGVLKGQQLYHNAKIVATVNEINGIRAATTAFQDAYSALPGDLANGDTRIPGCTATCQNNAGGAGDGFIGWPYNITLIPTYSLAANSPIWSPQQETLLFWAELSKSGFLSGVNGDAILAGAPFSFGVTHPAAPIGGGFVILDGTLNPDGQPGHDEAYYMGRATESGYNFSGPIIALVSSPMPAAGTLSYRYGTPTPLTPLEAFQLDSKMDDGDPSNGIVEAYGTPTSCYDTNAATGGTPSGIYNLTIQSQDCGLFFTLQK